ncbi:hypothetical protein SPISAL_06255 [Spiribacter salinus M19-40]|uniref:Chalcone isomerase domain-containing protein n=1 Tax=Spiribacter salinus M19-40 TaxID=1260251 RepID=R4V8N2_9GAMM|nr:chalcone isomerase family protein [Spiribacter salinus]AGM41345.1 hypothetical protein SPISAL_06255 [Spiribacter salinus M19-40]
MMRRLRTPERWRQALLTAIVSGLLALPGIALATVEENGATFETSIELGGENLALSGTGVAKYRVVFTVYAAAFYVPPQTARAEVLEADTPRRLEIEYFHDISSEDIIEAANTKLDDQLAADEHAQLESQVERFHALFTDVSPGDRYRMDYTPSEGIELRFNGEPVGTVEGGDFARAYFAIWLDEKDPLSSTLRDNLLAGTE